MAERFEDSILTEEISGIIESNQQLPQVQWICTIHAGDTDIPTYAVLNLDILRLYDQQYGDEIRIRVDIDDRHFPTHIYPNKDSLEVTLLRRPVKGEDYQDDVFRPIEERRFRAVLIDQGDPSIGDSQNRFSRTQREGTETIETIEFQLLDLALEKLRFKTTGTIMVNTTPANALRTLLGAASERLNVDAEASIRGVDLVPPSQEKVRDHVIIPHGTKVIDLPTYIQTYCGGIYGTGIGQYLQKGIWYIYPEFNTERFEREEKTLTVINVPENIMPGIEKTYRYTDNQVIIACTGEVKFRDDSEALLLNEGSGYRFVDADKVIDHFSVTENNKTHVKRKDNIREFVSEIRNAGSKNVLFSPERITQNRLNQYSRLARRSGSYLQVDWENSDESLIYPGMPVKFLYVLEGEVMELHGVVVQAQHFYMKMNQGSVVSKHKSESALTLFVRRPFND